MRCEEVLRKIAENLKNIQDSEKELKEEVQKLAVFSKEYIDFARPEKINARLNRLIDNRIVVLRDGKYCFFDNCIDISKYYSALDKYLKNLKELRKNIREMFYCEL